VKAHEKLALGLVHYPVVDRLGKVVATNITNFDVHDIARAARTYGIARYFLIHPAQEQLMFVSRLKDHWTTGFGAKFNPMRKTALGIVEPVESIEEALRLLGPSFELIVTSAKDAPDRIPFKDFKRQLEDPNDSRCYLLVFGTGFGMTQEVLSKAAGRLEPIKGPSMDDYRHLSVRSAATICLDRLLATW
jgi:hypothetical protein